MGTWLARVYFPDGRVRYVEYSTVVAAVWQQLHADFKLDEWGGTRSLPSGEPDPTFPDAPLSAPEDMIPVRVETEPDGRTWSALYCPSQNRLVDPVESYNTWRLQRTYNLVLQGGKEHLMPCVAVKSKAHTLCGEAVTGDILPFFIYGSDNPFVSADEPVAKERDLYAEWTQNRVCRKCLLHPEALRSEGTNPNSTTEPRRSGLHRYFGWLNKRKGG